MADPRRGLLSKIAATKDLYSDERMREAKAALDSIPRFGLVTYVTSFETYVHEVLKVFTDRYMSVISFEVFRSLCSFTDDDIYEKIVRQPLEDLLKRCDTLDEAKRLFDSKQITTTEHYIAEKSLEKTEDQGQTAQRKE